MYGCPAIQPPRLVKVMKVNDNPDDGTPRLIAGVNEACKLSPKYGEVIVIVGARGSGKTSNLFRILEDYHTLTNKTCYVIGIPEVKSKLLPPWAKIITDLNYLPEGCILGVDEAGIMYTAKSKADSLLGFLIQLCRQKNLILTFANLNTTSIQIDIIRNIDTLIVHEPSLLQAETERPAIRRLMKEAVTEFYKLPNAERIKHGYLITRDCRGMIKIDLPSFWSRNLSVSWSDDPQPADNPISESQLEGAMAGEGWAIGDYTNLLADAETEKERKIIKHILKEEKVHLRELRTLNPGCRNPLDPSSVVVGAGVGIGASLIANEISRELHRREDKPKIIQVKSPNPPATVEAITYGCDIAADVGLCTAHPGTLYRHKFERHKPKVVAGGGDGSIKIIGKVDVKESGINDADNTDTKAPAACSAVLGTFKSIETAQGLIVPSDGEKAILMATSDGERLCIESQSKPNAVDGGITFYGSPKCPICKDLRAKFNVKQIKYKYVDCDENSQTCDIKQIKLLPRVEIQTPGGTRRILEGRTSIELFLTR